MADYTCLDVSVFALGKPGQASADWAQFVGVLKSAMVKWDNDQVDGRGIAARYEHPVTVKQASAVDFTTFILDSGDVISNLNVSLWSIGGTDYIGDIKSGSISVSNPVAERAGLGVLAKKPVYVGGTSCEIQCEMFLGDANIVLPAILATGTIADFDVAVSITYGSLTFTAPMTLNAASVKVDRGAITMQDVTLKLKGTPTGPVTTALLGAVLLDSKPVYGVNFNFGAASVTTTVDGSGAPTQLAVMTKLNLTFSDGAIVEESGTLECQGTIALND